MNHSALQHYKAAVKLDFWPKPAYSASFTGPKEAIFEGIMPVLQFYGALRIGCKTEPASVTALHTLLRV